MELMKPGRDLRDALPKPILRTDVMEMKDLKPGMVLSGTVRNVIDFGAFVDIGVHQDGLVHISEIADRYVKHPSQVLSVGDVVQVVVLGVDEKTHQPFHPAGEEMSEKSAQRVCFFGHSLIEWRGRTRKQRRFFL